VKLRVVEIKANIMRKNDALAARLRERFAGAGTLAVNLLSSPGSGTTPLLEETLRRLSAHRKVAALVGDQATANDAERLQRSGAPVRQITTAAECRLDADMIEGALAGWEVGPLEALFVENVGNLICPAEYDLGEDLRVVLFSVTEGEDKPLKYPLAFNTSQVVLVTKCDIADAVGFNREAAYASLREVNPGIEIIELSARTGEGMERWMALLEGRIARKSAALALAPG